jgi:hypothetical protein
MWWPGLVGRRLSPVVVDDLDVVPVAMDYEA